jgi:hypothetical protein
LDPCCVLGSRVLLREGAQVPEGDPAQGSWIRDALPFERGWLDPTVVIQGAISATLTAVGVVDKVKAKGHLQWGFNRWILYIYIYIERERERMSFF